MQIIGDSPSRLIMEVGDMRKHKRYDSKKIIVVFMTTTLILLAGTNKGHL
jgi:hypothetical protein